MTCRGLGRDITDEKMAAVTHPLVPAVGIALSTLTCVIYCFLPTPAIEAGAVSPHFTDEGAGMQR